MPVNQNVFDEQKMKAYANELKSEALISYIKSRITYSWDEISKQYFNYVEEAVFGMRLLSKFTLEGRILEVGSGPGMLVAWLHMNGVNITGIEPSEIGFEFNLQIQNAIWDYYKLPGNLILDLIAEDLDPAVHGKYDLLYSVNVVEHLLPKNIELAFNKFKSVLADGGMMLHHCPNYVIPFEPHYGLPLVPGFPQLIGKIKGVSKEGLWRSLNFITLPKVKKIASNIGMDVSFQQKGMKDTFLRLEEDKEFAERHATLVKIYPLLKKVGFISFLGLLPPVISTPMSFTLLQKGAKGSYNDKGLKISDKQKK
ncbi:class I SAM-dependent methyltransferase [Niastella sp. OAS944]|uniref:class I SAM-dependent methyltransferase n=1 Tax=Niastella sp. OAS944 TaxID=2664089 RepID=UPI00349A2417|nr:2-polyprenyl-3-methyl-5-hydroxy-6-metoxy-1,4-benzoquinol methylase [Chitinophagaceae bacterium OAS944]